MFEIIKPTGIVLTPVQEIAEMPQRLEFAGRTCYKSQGSITVDSADKFVRMICRRNHESVLEHQSITAKIICSRCCSHQLVRHRLGSYSQESQRYVNYNKGGFRVIAPPYLDLWPGKYIRDYNDWYRDTPRQLLPENAKIAFCESINQSCQAYRLAVDLGTRPEDARYMLPEGTATEVATTYNLRQWRHVFRERALNSHAQWEIRGIMQALLRAFINALPCVFEDLME